MATQSIIEPDLQQRLGALAAERAVLSSDADATATAASAGVELTARRPFSSSRSEPIMAYACGATVHGMYE